MAPGKSVAVLLPARYVPGERIGNVDRDVAAILKYYMDDDFDVLLECDCYGIGFHFSCTLIEDSNHRRDGYEIKIVDLIPTPKVNIRINRNGYVATFFISKIEK